MCVRQDHDAGALHYGRFRADAALRAWIRIGRLGGRRFDRFGRIGFQIGQLDLRRFGWVRFGRRRDGRRRWDLGWLRHGDAAFSKVGLDPR